MERIREYIAEEVSDWGDEVAMRVRFKDFSGQRSDYEPILGFWRNLIIGVSLHFDIVFFTPAQLRNEWFHKGGLSPLCMDRVLDVMREEGHIVRLEDLDDPTSALSRLYRKLRRSLTATEVAGEDVMVVMAVLKNAADRAVKRLTETHWTQCAVLTMPAFRDVCNGEADRASAVITYLSAQRKALTLSMNDNGNQIQGVKVSLSESPLLAVSALDRYLLQLIWTSEMLHQRLFLTDQRSQKSRKSALASLNSGNKHVALRHMREFKLANESREKCGSLLNRVEEVLNVIANAESTKKVSEAIQIGAQAIKENKISVEEVENSLQELEESIAVQKQVDSALGSAASYTFVESEEDIEEEFKSLELEIEGRQPTPKAEADSVATETEEALDSLSDSFSKLEVVSTTRASPAIKGSMWWWAAIDKSWAECLVTQC